MYFCHIPPTGDKSELKFPTLCDPYNYYIINELLLHAAITRRARLPNYRMYLHYRSNSKMKRRSLYSIGMRGLRLWHFRYICGLYDNVSGNFLR